jgi:hypothetical protein
VQGGLGLPGASSLVLGNFELISFFSCDLADSAYYTDSAHQATISQYQQHVSKMLQMAGLDDVGMWKGEGKQHLCCMHVCKIPISLSNYFLCIVVGCVVRLCMCARAQ